MYELENSDYFTNMNRVVEMFLKGQTNPTSIAKGLGLQRKDVVNYISAWQELARNNENIKGRAAEALTAMDKHYDMIIKELWEVVEAPTVDLKTKASTLKQIADVEAKRQETLQKAGLYDDSGISDELVAMEERVATIERILLDVARQYPQAKTFIMQELSNMGKPTTVEEDKPLRGEVVEEDGD